MTSSWWLVPVLAAVTAGCFRPGAEAAGVSGGSLGSTNSASSSSGSSSTTGASGPLDAGAPLDGGIPMESGVYALTVSVDSSDCIPQPQVPPGVAEVAFDVLTASSADGGTTRVAYFEVPTPAFDSAPVDWNAFAWERHALPWSESLQECGPQGTYSWSLYVARWDATSADLTFRNSWSSGGTQPAFICPSGPCSLTETIHYALVQSCANPCIASSSVEPQATCQCPGVGG